MCGYCNLWVCVCMGFVMCGFVCADFVICGSFENCVGVLVMCVLALIAFYISSFIYIFFFVTSVRTTATELKLN